MNSGQQKLKKEREILKAAEKLFFRKGFLHAKMEDIASEAGFSKVTLYSYFQSKENLYMAITYGALQYLIDLFYQKVDENKTASGIESFLALSNAYFDFCTHERDYAELLQNYQYIADIAISGKELDQTSRAMQESIYYRKIRDVQNLPLQISVEEIRRGQRDGSIVEELNPWLINNLLWSMAIGYASVNRRPDAEAFMETPTDLWKSSYIQILERVCNGTFDITSSKNNETP
ncbi:MAG: TetR/AcrR family transcriptional regulator [Bacteroidota bacterium]